MRLIYLDESARDDQFYFFGALVADAAAVKEIEKRMNEVAELISRHVPNFDPETEFHAVDIFHGKGPWKAVSPPWRVKACDLTAKILARSSARFVFRGVNTALQRQRYGERAFAAHLLTLAHILQELDNKLDALDTKDALGLLLADEHHSAPGARRSLRNYKVRSEAGYTTGPLRRLADTIYFGPSHESRLLQAADIATFFLNRHLTIRESDARSEQAVKKIVTNVRSITIDEYVWHPGKTQRPAEAGRWQVREA